MSGVSVSSPGPGPLLLPLSLRGRPLLRLGAVRAEPSSGAAWPWGARAKTRLCIAPGCIRCRLGGGGAAGVDDNKEDAMEGRSHLENKQQRLQQL